MSFLIFVKVLVGLNSVCPYMNLTLVRHQQSGHVVLPFYLIVTSPGTVPAVLHLAQEWCNYSLELFFLIGDMIFLDNSKYSEQ